MPQKDCRTQEPKRERLARLGLEIWDPKMKKNKKLELNPQPVQLPKKSKQPQFLITLFNLLVLLVENLLAEPSKEVLACGLPTPDWGGGVLL